MPEEFIIAEDLDLAWSNFDPFYPLPANSPFHVEREGKPLSRLKRALLRHHRLAPKYFFSGHRGCGKSTELNILAADADIRKHFFVVKYSVKDVCDVNNLNYVDVLFSIGAQLYLQYVETGNKLEKGLIEELEAWKGVIEKTTEKQISFGTSVEGGLNTFFLSVLAKIKAEDISRDIIRKTIEPKLSELIDKTNLIIANIESNEKKKVLVLIDDLDKPRLEQAKEIFYNSQTAITQPVCYIVYTVPISIFFTKQLTAIKELKYFLPNVKLHSKNDRNSKDGDGYGLMEQFIFNRMKADLIQPDALDLAITMGAGVFRETEHIMQIAADSAIENERDQIIKEDVKRAEREIRSDFKRILKTQDYTTLKEICQDNEIHGIEKIEDLLHNLSVLEYMNDETWCDIHPTLVELIEND
jgi:hypothetical protein